MKKSALSLLIALLISLFSVSVLALEQDPLKIANDGIRRKVVGVNSIEWDKQGAIKVSFSPTDWLLFSREEILHGQYGPALDFHTLRLQSSYNGEVWLHLSNKDKQQIIETTFRTWKLRYSNYQLCMNDTKTSKNLLLNRLNSFYSKKDHLDKQLTTTLIDEGLGAGIIRLKSGS